MTAKRYARGLVGALLFSLFAFGASGAAPASAAPRSVSVTLQPRQTVVPGGTTRYPFVIRTTGKVGTIGFAFSGAPAGANTSVNPLSGSQYELVVAVPSATPSGLFAVTVRTISRAPSKRFTVYLDVVASVTPPPVTTPTPPPLPPATASFGIRADTPEITVLTGRTAAFGFTVDRSGGYTGDVAFTATGLPAGVTANFAPNPTRGGTVLYATPSASTPNGRYTVTIKATSDPLNARFTSVILSVTSTPDFALVVPASVNLPIGGTVSPQIGYRLVGSTAPIVSLGVTGLPPGVSFSFVPNPTFGDSTLIFTATAGLNAGLYPITIVGVTGSITHSYPMALNLFGPAGGFGLSAAPSSLTIARGASSSYAVTIIPTGGFASSITFVVAGLPAGIAIGAGGSAPNVTLNVTVPVGAIPGTYPLVLTGSSGTLSASVTLTLIVT